MPAKKTTAHDELRGLRELAAAEHVRLRALERDAETSKGTIERARAQVIEALADSDDHAVAAARTAGEQAVAHAHNLEEQSAAARLRAERAQRNADVFERGNAERLLSERVAVATDTTHQLNEAAAQAVRLHRQLIAERTDLDRLVAVAGGEPRYDGPASTHPWERALNDLARSLDETPALEPPRPRWHGRQRAQERDRVHQLLRVRRERDQAALEELRGGAA